MKIAVFTGILGLLVFAWFGLHAVKMMRQEDPRITNMTRELVLNSEAKLPAEIKAEQQAEESSFFSLFTSKPKSKKIQFFDVSWRTLGQMDLETGLLPDNLSYLKDSYIRIAGYITPLQTDNPDAIEDFIFSPFIGACIHVPPPPENQAIYAKLTKPVNFAGLWQPNYLYGKLELVNKKVQSSDGSFEAVTGYTISDAIVIPKED